MIDKTRWLEGRNGQDSDHKENIYQQQQKDYPSPERVS